MKTEKEKKELCLKFFAELAKGLKDKYEVISSCNRDETKYLIPIGSISDLSYYGKPMWSFRVSDYWNWYSNLKKCSDPNMVQCETDNLPPAEKRCGTAATTPIHGWMVALYKNDRKYHVVYGDELEYDDEYYDEPVWEWVWNISDPNDIIELILAGEPEAIGGEP